MHDRNASGIMPAGPSQQDAKRAGSLTFEMEIVDPLPVLAKLQDIRQESDASLVNLVDTCAQCFQRMRDLQVELQSKLILTNTPPEVRMEKSRYFFLCDVSDT